MIITFCGHSNCLFSEEVKEQLKNICPVLIRGSLKKKKKEDYVYRENNI